MIQALIPVLFLLILASLGYSLYTMLKDGKSSKRTVRGLTLRVALSISLFALLFYGFATGQLKPHHYSKVSGSSLSAP